MLAALINVPAGIGYPLLFGFVAAESAGAFVPGETSLIIAAALAAQGQLSLPLVIPIAAGAAIPPRLGGRLLRALAAGPPGRGLVARRCQPDAVAPLPALERARWDRLGGDDRHRCIRRRPKRLGLSGRNRLRRGGRRDRRLPDHAPSAAAPASYRLAGMREFTPSGAIDGRWP